jgi:thiol-disulfide isomerase/thioredoxin
MRAIVTVVAFALLTSMPATAAPRASAGQVLAAAKAQAASEHKVVFLIFGASWCGPCHALDAFLAAAEIRPILEKHFVFANVNIQEQLGKHPELNTPGAEKLAGEFGGTEGVPFIVFLNSGGAPIVTSNRPVPGGTAENIGYPDAPEEIDWFMVMLKKSVPELTPGDAHTIETWLRQASGK